MFPATRRTVLAAALPASRCKSLFNTASYMVRPSPGHENKTSSTRLPLNTPANKGPETEMTLLIEETQDVAEKNGAGCQAASSGGANPWFGQGCVRAGGLDALD